MEVRMHGDFAAVASYLNGTITMPATVYEGPFSFTSAWIKDGGRWKMIQFHFSPLDPK
jgi:hypothetical protein